jgi:hypothetical protein
MMPACGIDGTPKIISPLGGPIVGVGEQRLRDADMYRIIDGQLGGNDLSEEMRIDRLT